VKDGFFLCWAAEHAFIAFNTNASAKMSGTMVAIGAPQPVMDKPAGKTRCRCRYLAGSLSGFAPSPGRAAPQKLKTIPLQNEAEKQIDRNVFHAV
jgi:hypothetical protein